MTTSRRTPRGIPSRIRIAPRFERRGTLYLLDILLHEIVHAWQHELLGDLEHGYQGHGPSFCRKANEIGAKQPTGEAGNEGEGMPVVVDPILHGLGSEPRSEHQPSG